MISFCFPNDLSISSCHKLPKDRIIPPLPPVRRNQGGRSLTPAPGSNWFTRSILPRGIKQAFEMACRFVTVGWLERERGEIDGNTDGRGAWFIALSASYHVTYNK